MDCPNKYKPWLEKEIRFIHDNYLIMDNKHIAFVLGRTEEAIRKKLNHENLKRPNKSDLPKRPKKRGRKKKINSVIESINLGLKVNRKNEKDLLKRKAREKQLISEAVWAANFVNDKKQIKYKELTNPIIVSIPEMRIKIQIDRSLPASKINKKISAIKEKYGADKTHINNFDISILKG